MRLAVYVPIAPYLVETILPRSAVVGSRNEPGTVTVLIDYEGNKFGAPALESYERRLLHAAGRHVEKYPTVARMVVMETDVVEVGEWDTETNSMWVTDRAALDAWLA